MVFYRDRERTPLTPRLHQLFRVKSFAMFTCELFQPAGDLGKLVDHIDAFQWVAVQVKQGEPDFLGLRFSRHAIAARLGDNSVLVGQVEFPSAVTTEYPFKMVPKRKGIVFVRIHRVWGAGNQGPDIFAIDRIAGQRCTGESSDRWQEIDRAKRLGRRGACLNLAWVLHDASTADPPVETGRLRTAKRGFPSMIAIRLPRPVV